MPPAAVLWGYVRPNSQLKLPRGTKQKRLRKKNNNKTRDAQNKRSSNEVRGEGPEVGSGSRVGKICGKGRSSAGSERERELWMASGELTE